MDSPPEDGKCLKRSGSFKVLPPNFSELRLVLLGNSQSLTATVGNVLLGKTEFTQNHNTCVKGSGTFKDKPLTVIFTPDELLTSTYKQKLKQFIKEIKDVSSPGPHVFLLVLQPEDFTEQHKTRLESVLESFSEQAFDRSLVLMFGPRFREKCMREPHVRDMILRCRYRYVQMDHPILYEYDLNLKEFKRKELFSRISDLLKEISEAHLTPDPSEDEDTGLTMARRTKEKPSLNLVLFGRTGAGKTSAAESILGPAEVRAASSPGQCVKHQGEVCGRWVSLVELPALSGEPLETVMQQCLRCISLCGPEGVHAFILVLPLGPLTDKDKAQLKTLQDTLGSPVHVFTKILITVDSDPTAPEVVQSVKGDRDIQELSQVCGGGYLIFNFRDQQQVSELLESVETLRAKKEPQSYNMETLVQAQMEKISALEENSVSRTTRDESTDCLRITLIGKTGSGKSSSGNTILGQKTFTTKSSPNPVTKACLKEQSTADGRCVSVVDTPGLFDTNPPHDEFEVERFRCVSLLSPGPHVFLFVLQLGRFTREERKTVELIKKGFGKGVEKFMLILLTYGDQLEGSIEKFIEESDESFKRLLSECGNRCHVFDNQNMKDRSQVKELLQKIQNMVKENGGACYTNDMLMEAYADNKREMQREREELERELECQKNMNMQTLKEKMKMQEEKEEMERKYKQELENLKQKMSQLEQNNEKERQENKREKEELKRSYEQKSRNL